MVQHGASLFLWLYQVQADAEPIGQQAGQEPFGKGIAIAISEIQARVADAKLIQPGDDVIVARALRRVGHAQAEEIGRDLGCLARQGACGAVPAAATEISQCMAGHAGRQR